ncbi:NfeD family protein [Chloroflexota bacterium]
MRKLFDTNFKKPSITDWGYILILLLDDAIIVALAIFAAWLFKISIPLPIIIAIGIIGGMFVFIKTKAALPTFRLKHITGREGMIGLQGIVIEPLNPVGTIMVNGERWKAKCVENTIEVDEEVEVTVIKGLKLIVKRTITR